MPHSLLIFKLLNAFLALFLLYPFLLALVDKQIKKWSSLKYEYCRRKKGEKKETRVNFSVRFAFGVHSPLTLPTIYSCTKTHDVCINLLKTKIVLLLYSFNHLSCSFPRNAFRLFIYLLADGVHYTHGCDGTMK